MPSSALAQQEQDYLTYERLSSLLQDPTSQTYEFAQLTPPDIHVVDVESVMSSFDDTQRQRLRDLYEDVELEELRDAIESSPSIIDALQNEAGTQINARDVIALDMREGGQIVAYVDPNHTLTGLTTDDSENREEDRDSSEMEEDQQQYPQSFERLHSAMHEMQMHTQALLEASDQRIRIVEVGDIFADLDDTLVQRLRVTYQNLDTEELHSALEDSEAIRSALDENGMQDLSNVVAVNVRDSGATIVFVDQENVLGSGDNEAQQQYPQSFERLHSAIHEMQMHTQALMEASDQRIRIVEVGDIFADLDDTLVQRLRVTYQNLDTEELHSALEDSEAIQSALNESGMQDHSNVVAVNVRDSGATIVFVDQENVLGSGDNDDSMTQEDEWEDRDSSEMEESEMEEAQQQYPQSFERLHSAMHEMQMHTQALMDASDQRIRVMHVEDILAGLNDNLVERLRLTYQNVETSELHSALQDSEAIMSALHSETVTQDPTDVVAVDVRDSGETILYVDPENVLESEDTSDYE